VGTLIPAEIRARFLARRTRWAHAALLAGLVSGGTILELGSRAQQAMLSFALVFALACAMRGLSAYFLASQSEPRPIPLGDTRISAAAFVAHARQGGHARLLVYLLALQLAVWIAAPFFTPYMLGTLGLSYARFMVLTGIALAARITALPSLGRFAHHRGTRRLLWLGALGVVPLPALWLVSDAFAWLLVLQIFAGVAWGAFELATLLSFFEHIPETRRTTVLSMYNLASALVILLGSLIGTALLRSFANAEAAFALVFLVSSAMRAMALFYLRRAPDVPTPAELIPLRTLAVRPSAGAIQRPVLAGLSDAETTPAD
jgi:predicted MFS family arabinose efflux permease